MCSSTGQLLRGLNLPRKSVHVNLPTRHDIIVLTGPLNTKPTKLIYFTSRKHTYIIQAPLNTTFIWLNWVYRGILYFPLFIFPNSAQKHRLWVLVRTALPRRSWQVPTIYVLSRNMKNISFWSENFQFLEVKFSIYLNRRVFVMMPDVNNRNDDRTTLPKCAICDNIFHQDLRCSPNLPYILWIFTPFNILPHLFLI